MFSNNNNNDECKTMISAHMHHTLSANKALCLNSNLMIHIGNTRGNTLKDKHSAKDIM